MQGTARSVDLMQGFQMPLNPSLNPPAPYQGGGFNC